MTTLAMIEEFIDNCKIIGKAPRSNKHFSYATWISGAHYSLERGMLPCGNPKTIAQHLRSHPTEVCICVTSNKTECNEITPFRHQILLIESKEEDGNADSVFDCVQKLLLRFNEWESSMKTALLEGRGYQALLTLSEPLLGNFISISNSQLRLLAYTKNIKIEDPIIQSLIKNGFHTKETVDLFEKLHTIKDWGFQKAITLKPQSDLNTHPVLDYVFRMQGDYFIHINMHCNMRAPSAGLVDAFQVLIDCLGYCVKQDWDNRFALEQEPSLLFRDLIENKSLGVRTTKERLKTIGLTPKGTYTLFAFRLLGESSSRTLLPYCVNRLKETFPTCFSGSHASYALLLDPSGVTGVSSYKQIRLFAEANYCSVGISDQFTDLSSFSFAYQQATNAIEVATSPQGFFIAQLDGKQTSPLYEFCDYFALFVTETARNNNHLIERYAQTSTVHKIAETDKLQGTNDLHILYVYLRNERKVSTTCKELFLHRNTLLYRMKRLEERFGLSLDDAGTRRQLMTELLLYRGDGKELLKRKEGERD